MKKYSILITLCILFLIPNVRASSNIEARIGNRFFDTLEEAIQIASSEDIITLGNNVNLEDPLLIQKNININLNGKTIEGKEKVFVVSGGSLNLTGNGTIRELSPYYGAIFMEGSTDPNKEDYSTLSVSSGITLEGWSGIFIDHVDKVGYGVLVNMNGTIKAVDDINGGSGTGVYVNGNIKHLENSPIINLGKTAKITSTGNGIYASGYATYVIDGSYIEGDEAALAIKSGKFRILSGTLVSNGMDKTPTSGNNNGINPSGTAIQIESNNSYAGNIELEILDGTFKSKNSHVIYEYTVTPASTKVKNISLKSGNYISLKDKDVFLLSDSFKSTHKSFISGGTFSSNPSSYLKSGYTTKQNSDGNYEVLTSTLKTFLEKTGNDESSNNIFIWVFVIIMTIFLSLLAYFKRVSILNILNKLRKS